MPALTCPHCGAFANFSPRHRWVEKQPRVGDVPYGLWACDNCHRPILGQEGPLGEPVDYHPRSFVEPSLPEAPGVVAADAREAHRCFSIGAYRAAVVMARRAMQSAAYDKGAPEGTLVEQIDWLEGQRLLTPQMKEVAHAIRLAGNIGAHPDRDGLRDVGEPEARAVIEFLDDFLRYVYEIPSRLERLKGGPAQEAG